MLPIWIIDLLGSFSMIVLSLLCLKAAYRTFKRDPDNAVYNHLMWFFWALFAFSGSRAIGHIIRHILYFAGYEYLWKNLSPISGSINTITFVVIASVTLFFNRMQNIMTRMNKDREKIEKTSQGLIRLNKDTEALVSERTRAEMALRVAHEVRNPVMVIGGLIRRIAEKAPECYPQEENLKKIITQAEKLETLVQDFENMRPELEEIITYLDLNHIVEEAMDAVRQEMKDKGIGVEYTPSKAPLFFQGNRQLIKIGIIHVLRNAVEVCSAGDKITVTTKLEEKGASVKIKDTGPGMPKEILDHVFEPFYTTEKGKTGLGLAYVRQIIEEHRGKVTIKSTGVEGTTITIIFPTHLDIELTGRSSK